MIEKALIIQTQTDVTISTNLCYRTALNTNNYENNKI